MLFKNISCPYCNNNFEANLSPLTTFHKVNCNECNKEFIIEIKYSIEYFYKPDSNPHDSCTKHADQFTFSDDSCTKLQNKVTISNNQSTKTTTLSTPIKRRTAPEIISISKEVIKTIEDYLEKNKMSIYELHKKHFNSMARSTLYSILQNGRGKKDYVDKVLKFYQEITPMGLIREANS